VRVAVCSWSLRPEGPDDLVEKVRRSGVSAVQLALDPVRTAWGAAATHAALSAADIEVVSGMVMMAGEDYTTRDTIRRTGGVRSDAHWEENVAASRENAALARELGLGLVTFHAGFIPHEADDPVRGTMLERLRTVIDIFSEHDVTIAVMGCRVNGPGETDDADLGLWCGPKFVNLKRGTEELGAYSYDDILARLKDELDALIAQREPA